MTKQKIKENASIQTDRPHFSAVQRSTSFKPILKKRRQKETRTEGGPRSARGRRWRRLRPCRVCRERGSCGRSWERPPSNSPPMATSTMQRGFFFAVLLAGANEDERPARRWWSCLGGWWWWGRVGWGTLPGCFLICSNCLFDSFFGW